MWHSYRTDISHIDLPRQFTYPFHYTPHALCVAAAKEVKDYLASRADWQEELQWGKMFGVLTVSDREGRVGFLAAFSGILAGSNTHDYFVPPVYDFLQPDSFFKTEEAQISDINHRIEALQQDETYRQAKESLAAATRRIDADRHALKAQMKADKALRDRLRKDQPEDSELMAQLTRQSQYQKAELKRTEKAWQAELAELTTRITTHEQDIEQLKQERKVRSAALQEELFRRFHIRNAQGEDTNLYTLFAQSTGQLPPAGAGECAAPKLLQYAYSHQLKPLAMAEFWWGHTTRTEVRRHGAFYPACQGKCAPILTFMLKGLDVEPNPLQVDEQALPALDIVYEDEALMVIDKPAGLLSAPGKDGSPSVYDLVRRLRPDAEGPLIVHRLDQATSGLLLIAKRKEVHEALQKQFLARQVKKRYTAILEKEVHPAQGTIQLPLCPDPLDRPRQMVHPQHGKPARTDYEVIQRGDGHTRVAFYPLTGRTHQLRVHAAHAEGLHAPIQGDKLYGATHTEGRLCLHADRLEFEHPITHQWMVVEKEAPF